MLMQYVFPEFRSPHGHMRARVSKIITGIIITFMLYNCIT